MSVVIKTKVNIETRDILDEFRHEDLTTGLFRFEMLQGGIYFEFDGIPAFTTVKNNKPNYVGNWIFDYLLSIIQSILEKHDFSNPKTIMLEETINMIITNINEKQINIKFFNSSILLNEFTVNKSEFDKAAIKAAEDFLATIFSKFPNIKNHESFLEFKKILDEAKKKLMPESQQVFFQ